MMSDIVLTGLASFAVWHFARAVYVASRHRYVGSRVYEADDPRRFRIGAWGNATGLILAVVGLVVIALDIARR
jgi:hypothetical protein